MTACSDERLADGARRELVEHILPFWRKHAVDSQRGGFVAEISNDLRRNDTAAKGLILNTRVLWTFAAVYRYTQSEHDAQLAHRAYAYLLEHFLDRQHGGFHWLLDPQGQPFDSTKKIYGQAFGVYALAEYYRTFGDSQALSAATDVFRLIEQYSHDRQYGGYAESLSRDWQPIADVRLSDKDLNEKKSMNNHLHVLEAYTNLLRVWADPLLTRRLESLVTLFQTRILNPLGTHLQHFFDEAWQPRSASYTFGHDIEGSWLLCEAAETLGGPDRVAAVRDTALQIARAVLWEGVDADGGLCYEARDGQLVDDHKEWWPQAEAVVGFYHAWQISGDPTFHQAAENCWRFIQTRIVDRKHGEWYWRVSRDGIPDDNLPKVSAWKCPYHNSRCCLEIIRRAAVETKTQ